jgi:hypothetical protein
MAPAISRTEPVGIIVQDGGEAHAAPRILLWHWAVEEETPERERDY